MDELRVPLFSIISLEKNILKGDLEKEGYGCGPQNGGGEEFHRLLFPFVLRVGCVIIACMV